MFTCKDDAVCIINIGHWILDVWLTTHGHNVRHYQRANIDLSKPSAAFLKGRLLAHVGLGMSLRSYLKGGLLIQACHLDPIDQGKLPTAFLQG